MPLPTYDTPLGHSPGRNAQLSSPTGFDLDSAKASLHCSADSASFPSSLDGEHRSGGPSDAGWLSQTSHSFQHRVGGSSAPSSGDRRAHHAVWLDLDVYRPSSPGTRQRPGPLILGPARSYSHCSSDSLSSTPASSPCTDLPESGGGRFFIDYDSVHYSSTIPPFPNSPHGSRWLPLRSPLSGSNHVGQLPSSPRLSSEDSRTLSPRSDASCLALQNVTISDAEDQNPGQMREEHAKTGSDWKVYDGLPMDQNASSFLGYADRSWVRFSSAGSPPLYAQSGDQPPVSFSIPARALPGTIHPLSSDMAVHVLSRSATSLSRTPDLWEGNAGGNPTFPYPLLSPPAGINDGQTLATEQSANGNQLKLAAKSSSATQKRRQPLYVRENRPPRPPNAWILYRSDKLRQLREQEVSNVASDRLSERRQAGVAALGGRPQADVSKVISEMWKNESKEAKLYYEQQAEIKKIEHLAKYPDYRFNPVRRKDKPGSSGRMKEGQQTSGNLLLCPRDSSQPVLEPTSPPDSESKANERSRNDLGRKFLSSEAGARPFVGLHYEDGSLGVRHERQRKMNSEPVPKSPGFIDEMLPVANPRPPPSRIDSSAESSAATYSLNNGLAAKGGFSPQSCNVPTWNLTKDDPDTLGTVLRSIEDFPGPSAASSHSHQSLDLPNASGRSSPVTPGSAGLGAHGHANYPSQPADVSTCRLELRTSSGWNYCENSVDYAWSESEGKEGMYLPTTQHRTPPMPSSTSSPVFTSSSLYHEEPETMFELDISPRPTYDYGVFSQEPPLGPSLARSQSGPISQHRRGPTLPSRTYSDGPHIPSAYISATGSTYSEPPSISPGYYELHPSEPHRGNLPSSRTHVRTNSSPGRFFWLQPASTPTW